jgi:hypothetical protein
MNENKLIKDKKSANHNLHWQCRYICFVLFCLFNIFCYSNEFYCRRHIIIAVDESSSFQNCDQNKRHDLYKNIKALLLNTYEVSPDKATLWKERKNRICFFDGKIDDISLFTFGMSSESFTNINSNLPSAMSFFDTVNKGFIHYKSDFRKSKKSINKFIEQDIFRMFFIRNLNTNLHSGKYAITLSQFLYPSILNYLVKNEYAEDYILIIFSDFASGSVGPSMNDLDRIKELCNYDYLYYNAYMKSYNNMKSNFYKIDYFTWEKNPIMASAYKIKPMAGSIKPEEVSTFLNSDLDIYQNGFLSEDYTIKKIQIKFTNNNNLIIKGIRLKVTAISDGKFKIVADVPIDKFDYDSINQIYTIPSTKVILKGINRKSSCDSLSVCFNFITNFTTNDNSGVGYIYKVERIIPSNDKIFSSSITHKIMQAIIILLIIGIILLILRIMIHRGREKNYSVKCNGFNDRFTEITTENGRVDLPCWFRNQNDIRASINIELHLDESKKKFRIPWISSVLISTDDSSVTTECNVPANSIMFALDNQFTTRGVGIEKLSCWKNGNTNFNVYIYINPQHIDFSNHLKISIRYRIKITSKCLFFKYTKLIDENYTIFVHPNIGDSWLGIDPGTTGSSISIGSTSAAVNVGNPRILQISDNNQSIIPSKLILKKDRNINNIDISNLQPNIDYLYGLHAEREWIASSEAGDNCWQSIKKLLGFNDDIIGHFGNNERHFKGVDLAYLLIKGLVATSNSFYNGLAPNIRRGISFPKRAVVAIPNNYTLPKIMDMVNSIKRLGQFEEVRYIYEPEAILFNYLLKNGLQRNAGLNEIILVYDMGGATINVSIFNVIYSQYQGTVHFNIETLGRIGYCIGGDNIDYALMCYLFNLEAVKSKFSDNHEIEKFQKDNKNKILADVLSLKKDLIAYYNNNNNDYVGVISSPILFSQFLSNLSGKRINSSDFHFNEESEESFKEYIFNDILTSEPLKNIFLSVKDSVNEIIEMTNTKQLSNIIFSGRTVLFPLIKANVKEALKIKGIENYNIIDGFNSISVKTAVSYGACLYGLFHNLYDLNNSKVMNSFGFKNTTGASSDFHNVIEPFQDYKDISGNTFSEAFQNNFNADGNYVNFYQIMGNCNNDVFGHDNKHKRIFLGGIHATTTTDTISMTLHESGKIIYKVRFINGDVEEKQDSVQSHDIFKENSEAYVFATAALPAAAQPVLPPTEHTTSEQHMTEKTSENNKDKINKVPEIVKNKKDNKINRI